MTIRRSNVLIGNKREWLDEDGTYILYPLSNQRRSRKKDQVLGADISGTEYGWRIQDKREGKKSIVTATCPSQFELTITDSEDRDTVLILAPEDVYFLKELIDSWEEYRSLFDDPS